MSKESLHAIFRDLHAHRVQTMDPAKLQVNINQRKTLVDNADPSRWLKAGEKVAAFSVPEVDGGLLTLESLTARGPAVLIFFRFEGCPACNLALPYYQRNLLPGLKQLGATLTALSPQVPEKLIAIKQRHALGFNVASDLGNELGKRFGILYTFDEASQAQSKASGTTIGETTGTGTWELPQPTAIVIDRDQVARFVDVHPDWLLRTEADEILTAVRALVETKQASATI